MGSSLCGRQNRRTHRPERRRLIGILHFGHSGITKMLSDAELFRCPEVRKDIEQKVNDCNACLATGKNLKYQIPKNQHGKLEKLTEPGQKRQIKYYRKITQQTFKWRISNIKSNRSV